MTDDMLKNLDIHAMYDEIMRRHSMNWLKSDLKNLFEVRDRLRDALAIIDKFCAMLEKESSKNDR